MKTVDVEYNVPYELAFFSEDRYLVMYGGAGAGKSYVAAQKILMRALKQPGHRFLCLRKVRSTIKHSVFQLFKEELREWEILDLCEINKTELTIQLPGGSEILHTGLDDAEKLKSIQGVTGIWVEEASEITEEDFIQTDLRLRGDTVGYKQIILTYNPLKSAQWIKEQFIDDPPENATILQTTFEDNVFIDTEYQEDVLTKISDPQLRSVYLEGKYPDHLDDPWQVIPTEWVIAAQDRWKEMERPQHLSALGCDPARGGQDETVLAPRYEHYIDELVTYPGSSTPDGPSVAAQVIDHLQTYTEEVEKVNGHFNAAGRHPTTEETRFRGQVILDVIGIGSAVYDALIANDVTVQAFNSSEKSDRTDRSGQLGFRNKRAEGWWTMRELLDPSTEDMIALPPDRQLRADLTAATYKVGVSGIQIESKEDIKKRLGRSPDRGDAVVYAFAGSGVPQEVIRTL